MAIGKQSTNPHSRTKSAWNQFYLFDDFYCDPVFFLLICIVVRIAMKFNFYNDNSLLHIRIRECWIAFNLIALIQIFSGLKKSQLIKPLVMEAVCSFYFALLGICFFGNWLHFFDTIRNTKSGRVETCGGTKSGRSCFRWCHTQAV